MLEIKSPLKAWKGSFKVPDPDEFDGVHWRRWRDSFNSPKRKDYSLTHVYCYSGLELIQAAGEWDIQIPLSEVQAWENKPEDERIKLVAWVGKNMMDYIDNIIDPKE